MKNTTIKILFTTLLIIITLFVFTINCYCYYTSDDLFEGDYSSLLSNNSIYSYMISYSKSIFSFEGSALEYLVLFQSSNFLTSPDNAYYVVVHPHAEVTKIGFEDYNGLDRFYYISYNSSGCKLDVIYFDVDGNVLKNVSYSSFGTSFSAFNELSSSNYLYSTSKLYNGDTLVNPYHPVSTEGVAILETAEQIPQAMIQVLQKIIPIGLVILSAILVISLIKLVICRMQ